MRQAYDYWQDQPGNHRAGMGSGPSPKKTGDDRPQPFGNTTSVPRATPKLALEPLRVHGKGSLPQPSRVFDRFNPSVRRRHTPLRKAFAKRLQLPIRTFNYSGTEYRRHPESGRSTRAQVEHCPPTGAPGRTHTPKGLWAPKQRARRHCVEQR